MRVIAVLLLLTLASVACLAQELSPKTNVSQPVVQQVSAIQSNSLQVWPQQPAAVQNGPYQTTVQQAAPPSLSVPMNSMPVQPHSDQPMATMCGCGLRH